MSQREALVRRFSRGWGSGGKETRCGAGSTLASTAHIRPHLRALWDRYGVLSVCDAGAGDLNWIRHVDLTGLTYRAFDLVPRAEGVVELDITTEPLPACDLILCRAVLNHIEPERVRPALDLFKGSARYLLATQFSTPGKWWRDFAAYDLREFDLGEPLEALTDNPGELALWRL